MDNVKEGYGKYIYGNGDRYEGNFIDGSKEGQGKVYWKSGEIFEGGMKSDMMHGNGLISDRKGTVKKILYNMNAIEDIK